MITPAYFSNAIKLSYVKPFTSFRKRAITSLTKFVNLASSGQLPEFVAPILCNATLTALKKLKGGVRPIAVGEVIRLLIAKCIAREAKSEAADLFNIKELGVAVKGGAEA